MQIYYVNNELNTAHENNKEPYEISKQANRYI